MTNEHKYDFQTAVVRLLCAAALTGYLCLMAWLLSGCERRDLWVLADEYRQVELLTDWSGASERPGGMTAWFIANDGSGYTSNTKTAEVSHTWLSLPRGNYTGLVFDYSPEEYGHNRFVSMDDPLLAEVSPKPAADQPSASDPRNEELFGDAALREGMTGIGKNEATGLYEVKAEPDDIHVDVLSDVDIITGSDGDYILWEGREEYGESLVTQTLNARPLPVVWKLRVVVHVRGFNYMHSVRGSIAGLADGFIMPLGRHDSRVCLQGLDEWERKATGGAADNTGYVTALVGTFGLPEAVDPDAATRDDRDGDVSRDYISRMRLNLSFLLRDQETVVNCHFDVDPYVSIYDDELAVRIEIPIELGPDLPYVSAKDGAGFDAEVSPWGDGGTVETTM